MANQFYKYSDNPTVYNQQSQALDYNNYLSQGGLKDFSNVQTIQGTAPTLLKQTTPPTGQAGPTIVADKLGTQGPTINLPTPNTNVSTADALVAGTTSAVKSYADYVKEQTPPQTEASKTQDTLVSQLLSLAPELGGKQTALAQKESDLGVPDISKQLAQINSDISGQTAEYNVAKANYEKLLTNAEGKVETIGSIRGEQAQIARSQAAELNLKASEIALTQARGLGLQGQLESAQKTAARAIDLQYASKEDEYNLKLKQLDLIQPVLNNEEKIQAAALKNQYEDQKQQLTTDKEKAKENIQLSLSNNVQTSFFTKPDGTVVRTNDGYEFHNPQEAFAAGVAPDFSNAPRVVNVGKTQVETINGQKYNFVFDTAGNVVQKVLLGGSGSTLAPSTTGLTSKQTTRIKQIITANPGEYGNAADQIDREFGAGTATKADALLKSSYLIPADAADILNNSGPPPTVEAWSAGRQKFINDHPYDPVKAATDYDKFVKKPTKSSSTITNPFQ